MSFSQIKAMPKIEFKNSYAHTNWNMQGLYKDIGNTHLTMIKSAPAAHKCAMDDWVFLHYKGWDSNGKVITDSRKARNNHEAYFRVGNYEMSKCWDIAIQQMHQGESANVTCAGDSDIGGARNIYA